MRSAPVLASPPLGILWWGLVDGEVVGLGYLVLDLDDEREEARGSGRSARRRGSARD